MECFVIFTLRYRNSFLVYLPLVNNAVYNYKIYNPAYKECRDMLLNYGNLDELEIEILEKTKLIDMNNYKGNP